MSRYRKFVICILAVEVMMLVLSNVIYFTNAGDTGDKQYRVEALRIAKQLQNTPIEELDLTPYEEIQKVSVFDPSHNTAAEYVVLEVNGIYYRMEYEQQKRESIFLLNTMFFLLFAGSAWLLWYIGRALIQPFERMSHLTKELATGNLSTPIPEEKSKFFGKFLWGMDMLRDKLEADKEKELALQKEKKELVLSLAHDIKTPLSAIRLYAKSISAHLYDSEEQKQKALRGIDENIAVVEGYINEIVDASREDFLNLEVTMGEFYLSEVLHGLTDYYKDKLALLHTEFQVEQQPDCLLRGDKNRLLEVYQNVMENAIKYGDGKWISLSAAVEEDCRLITIRNSGCTIKEEELPHIFDSFYRGSNSQKVKGSGLGLYIAKTLLKEMDGDIYAQIHGGQFAVTIVVRMA